MAEIYKLSSMKINKSEEDRAPDAIIACLEYLGREECLKQYPHTARLIELAILTMTHEIKQNDE